MLNNLFNCLPLNTGALLLQLLWGLVERDHRASNRRARWLTLTFRKPLSAYGRNSRLFFTYSTLMTMSDDVDLWVELEQLSVYLRLARSLEAVYGN